MTWYAQQIFAQPRNNVIAAFQSIPSIAKAIYHIPHLRNMASEENVVDGVMFDNDEPVNLHRTVRSGPKLPPGGLLVIRELCGSGDDHDCAGWFDEDAVFWDDIGDGLPASDDPILEYDNAFANAPDWWASIAPPTAMLRQLQTLADTTKSVIAYYACHMWGGNVECVFGWVWDGHRKSSCFYRGIVASDDEGKETTGFYTDLTGAFAVDRFGQRQIVDGDVLTLILLHFGLLLRDGHFDLHTRSFPWNQYKLNSSAR